MKDSGNAFSQNIVEPGIRRINECAPIMSIEKLQVSGEVGQLDEIKISILAII